MFIRWRWPTAILSICLTAAIVVGRRTVGDAIGAVVRCLATGDAPYMHDGSMATLADVVDWYAHAGAANRNLDYRYRWIERPPLSQRDRDDLVAFVEACSGPLPVVERGRLPP